MRNEMHGKAQRTLGRLRPAAALLLLAMVGSALGGCFLFPNTAPVAWIEADRTQGVAPLTVRFDGTLSLDPDGSIRRYSWQFGDGQSASGAIVSHTFAAAGTYAVTLTVTDTRWARSSATLLIVVRATNALPVAAFSVSPSEAFPGQLIGFDASASYDPDGEIVSYAWSFGDGSTASGVAVAHAYTALGTYEVSLTLRDNDDGERTATSEVEVVNTVGGSDTLSRHYEWEYDGVTETCDLEIPADLYAYYRAQPRMAWAARDYDEYVLDPLDDDYLDTVAAEILQSTAGDYDATLENALFFVQHCIRYVSDPAWYEYPRYPVETLVDGIGDCEDTAILYTSIVRTLGHGALMVVVDTDADGTVDHMAAWVPIDEAFVILHPDRSFWEYHGTTYAFAETAVDGGYLPLGVDPWGLDPSQIHTIYDVSSVDRNPQAVCLGMR